MRIEGEAGDLEGLLFPNGLVPKVLQLIVYTWSVFERPTDGEDEPKITNRFVLALNRERRKQRYGFLILPHAKDVEHVNLSTGQGFVEIDICIFHGYEPRCYFGIEAKKLNTTSAGGKWESRAGEYAGSDGMGCFVDGRYASHQCEGAMVGYVMDGDRDRAKTSIAAAIQAREVALRVALPCTLHPAQHLPDETHAFETRHHLDRGEFTLHHVLLAA